MKKALLVATCVVMLVCLCACSGNSYKKLNKAVAADYAKIELTVETVKGSDKLTSTFVVNNQNGVATVSYHVESFTEISTDPDKIPDDYKTVREGSVKVENGIVTGDVLPDVPMANVAKIPYHFDKSYFEYAKFEKGVFTAKVKSTQEFANDSSLSRANMTVTFNYEAAQKVLTVSYVDSNGVSVKITYKLG